MTSIRHAYSSTFRLLVLVQVVVGLPPRDWGGGYGADEAGHWIYVCDHCTWTKSLDEERDDNPPLCKRGHGPMHRPEDN